MLSVLVLENKHAADLAAHGRQSQLLDAADRRLKLVSLLVSLRWRSAQQETSYFDRNKKDP